MGKRFNSVQKASHLKQYQNKLVSKSGFLLYLDFHIKEKIKTHNFAKGVSNSVETKILFKCLISYQLQKALSQILLNCADSLLEPSLYLAILGMISTSD